MAETIHLIKKYANGRLYDATDKKYVTTAELAEFMENDVSFSVVVSKTDEDITESVVAKLKEDLHAETDKKAKPTVKPKMKAKTETDKGKEKHRTKAEEEEISTNDGPSEFEVPKSILGRLLRKGGVAFSEVPRKSAELFQSAMTMAEEEFDKRVKQLVKGKELSESESKRLKEEIFGLAKHLKSWLGDNVEERVNDMLSMMNLATRDQLDALEDKIDQLNQKLEALSKTDAERKAPPVEVVPEGFAEKP